MFNNRLLHLKKKMMKKRKKSGVANCVINYSAIVMKIEYCRLTKNDNQKSMNRRTLPRFNIQRKKMVAE